MSAVPSHVTRSSLPAKDVLPFDERQPEAIRLYPLSNYTFGTKEAQPEEDPSVKDRLKRLEDYYGRYGMRRSGEGIANAFFKLPGDWLDYNVDEIQGFTERMNERLAAPPGTSLAYTSPQTWNVHSTLATWWRPNFDQFMYPFLPPHATRPKECKKLYLLQLPESRVLSVPKNMKLLAVPLFELYDNSPRYGPQISALPHYLSRFRWEFVDEEGKVVAWTPGGAVDEMVKTKILAGGEDVEVGANGSGEVKMEDAK
ncbi:hypothetical protein B0A48_00779 [Cryoendolithus antarcticus]|uniref:Cleavage and polyadenylation specificity factor subunit 5 n=1 Tax=Cryoendolithus antarcticus TaxID=1507870 RepID=A0A1V8TRI0_9PEZI|nr:hypothetical protein B0A48_00779 [Cryoendolithus antarcticus]